MTATLRETYAAGLKALGYQQLETKSSKYWVFRKAFMPYVFLGKAGAVRMGRAMRTNLTFPMCDGAKADVLKHGQKALSQMELPLR